MQNKLLNQGDKSNNYKRLNDSNNAHKKMITCLNKATITLSNKKNP